MFRFTIRDVLRLLALVGIGLGWYADRRAQFHAATVIEP